MVKKDLILIGGGGHCKSCIDVIESGGNFKIIGIVDREEKLHQKVLGYEIIASDKDLPDLIRKHKNVLITIGGIKDPSIRVKQFDYLKQLGANFPLVISPQAYVAKSARIEEGTIVMHRTLVNTDVKIGRNCIVNTFGLVEHDSTMGDHSHLSTGAVVNGTCSIGQRVFIGSNSVVAEGVSISNDVIIGAGSFVAKSINQAGIYIAPGRLVGLCKT